MMLSSTYEAFIAAGTPAEKAKAASEEIAGFDSRLGNIEVALAQLKVMNVIMIGGVASLVIEKFF